MTKPIVIVGAGLSGLACARELHRRGLPVRVFERDARVGGRVQTDEVNGFRLDRGFQVLLTDYPQARRQLDLAALDLRAFDPGAVLWTGQTFETMGDPIRAPSTTFETLLARTATFRDKLEVLRLKRDLVARKPYEAFGDQDIPTYEFLVRRGFSRSFIAGFFRPFLGGVFLESRLETSARFFAFVFRLFGSGDAAVPALGMGQISAQLASGLPPDVVRLETTVQAVTADGVTLDDGSRVDALAVVVATEGPAAARLLPDLDVAPGNGVTCHYFATDRAPTTKRSLHLDGSGQGPINNLHVASNVSPEVAPPGQHLVSVSCLGASADPEAQRVAVKEQATAWFGECVQRWRPLRHYVIPYALPSQRVGRLEPAQRPCRHPRGVYVCGDHLDQASIDGALASGQRVAMAVSDQVRVSAVG